MLELINKYRKYSLFIYNTSLILILFGLYFSRACISIGFILFVLNWFIEGSFKQKWLYFRENLSFTLISLIAVIHTIGMLNTSNLSYGLADLKIKLPMLLPVFFFSTIQQTESIKTKKYFFLFLFFTVAAIIFSFIKFETKFAANSVEDLFKLAITGQNIQVALFVCIAIAFVIEQLFVSGNIYTAIQKVFFYLSLILLIIYVYLLNSLTGYAVLLTIVLFSLIFLYIKKKSRIALVSILAFLFSYVAGSIYLINLYQKFNTVEKLDFAHLDKKTINGNDYQHNTLSKRIENGHYIDIYICRKELKENWEKRSTIPFYGKDLKKQDISETIIRYLSSKGLRKDSSSLALLTNAEISYIENGCANHLYINKYSLESRMYNIFWQLKTYKETGNSTGQSVSQRIEFLKAAKILIKENFWFGVGTGDVMNSFKETLTEMNTKLDPAYYNRIHNQYIVELVALGILGFLAFIFIIFYPVFRFKIWNNYLFMSFYIIILISFFTDNPLETQLGVSFFSVFFCLLSVDFLKTTSKD